MDYLVNDKKFHFSYKELQKQFLEFETMSLDQFYSDIPKLLHYVAFVAFVKEIGTRTLLADDGLLHELIHMLNGVELVNSKEDLRNTFNNLMRL